MTWHQLCMFIVQWVSQSSHWPILHTDGEVSLWGGLQGKHWQYWPLRSADWSLFPETEEDLRCVRGNYWWCLLLWTGQQDPLWDSLQGGLWSRQNKIFSRFISCRKCWAIVSGVERLWKEAFWRLREPNTTLLASLATSARSVWETAPPPSGVTNRERSAASHVITSKLSLLTNFIILTDWLTDC